MRRLRYLVMLSTMSSWGASPPSWPLPSPIPSPSALVMRPYWIQYSPSVQKKKCIQLGSKIVKDMNQWSISGIFNYYSVCCTEKIMVSWLFIRHLSRTHSLQEDFDTISGFVCPIKRTKCPHESRRPERTAALHFWRRLSRLETWLEVKRMKVTKSSVKPN